jgi:hypothetical protein
MILISKFLTSGPQSILSYLRPSADREKKLESASVWDGVSATNWQVNSKVLEQIRGELLDTFLMEVWNNFQKEQEYIEYKSRLTLNARLM